MSESHSIPESSSRGRLPQARKLRAIALTGMVALAVTQPVLDALQRNDTYRMAADLGWKEYLVLALLLTCGLTPLAILLDWGVYWLTSWFRGIGRNSALFLLSLLAVFACLRPIYSVRRLEETHMVWLVTLCSALPVAWLITARFERWAGLRQWLAVLAGGAVLFPAAFTMQMVRTPAAAGVPGRSTSEARRPTHVVLVVFDEFCGTTLLTEKLEVDAVRFPGFARLANEATWYRHATSSHGRTDKAVPAILASRVMPWNTSPEAKNYPGNLFEVLEQSRQFGMTAFEPVTHLYDHRRYDVAEQEEFPSRVGGMVNTLAAVYPRLILPHDTPIDFPGIPHLWLGIRDDLRPETERKQGRIAYNWGLERELQLDHFLSTIEPAERSHLWFLHAGLPHFPWCLTASGKRYVGDLEAQWPPPSARGDIGEDWSNDAAATLRCEFRYRQQAGYADHFLERLQSRLKEQGIWDSCLLIVMADHGVSFRPGSSRRYPDTANLPDLMNIPLFIKYPNQAGGRIDDRNVESIDILPTIADVLGMEADSRWEGTSALSGTPRLRKSFTSEDETIIVEPRAPRLAESARRQAAVYGATPLAELPRAAMSRPEWLGRTVSDFTVRDVEIRSFEFAPGTHPPVAHRPENFSPSLLQGSMSPGDLPGGQLEMVAAIDGIVIDSCRLYTANFDQQGFHLWASEEQALRENAVLELFLVDAASPNDWQRVYRGPL